MIPKQVTEGLRHIFCQLFTMWRIAASYSLYDRTGPDGKREIVYAFSGVNHEDVEVLQDKRVGLEMLILSVLSKDDQARLRVEILGRR